MQLLNKNTDYAIRALLHLFQNNDGFVSSTNIARDLNIPLQFVRNILKDLAKNGYIESKEGVQGGVKVNKETRDARLREIMKLFQGEISISSCMFRKKICDQRSKCVLRRRIQKIEKMVQEEFDKVSIGQLLNDLERE